MDNNLLTDGLTTELKSAVQTIKTAILQSQYRAAKSVNQE